MHLGKHLIRVPVSFHIRGLLAFVSEKNFPEGKHLIKTIWPGRKRFAQISTFGTEKEL